MGGTKPISDMSDEDLAQLAMAAVGEDHGTVEPDNLPHEPIPEDPDNVPDAGPQGQPDEGAPVEPEDPDGGEPSTGGDEPADSALLKALRERGWNHNFESEEDAIESLVELRRFAGSKLEHEALGKLAAEAGMTPDQLQQLHDDRSGDQDPFAWKPPVEYDPRWDREIKVSEDGTLEGPPELVRGFQEFIAYKDDYWGRLGNDPAGFIRGNRQVIEDIINDTLARHTAAEQTRDFLRENGEFIGRHRTQFEQLLGEGMAPHRALDYLKVMHPDDRPAEAPTGQDAIEADRAKLKKRRAPTKRPPAPVRAPEEVDYSSMSEEDLARLAVKEKGLTLHFDEP